ncbi:MAG: PTS sugar transporter subunit IIA [Verrucomicrobiae bacterium]|nr:PTS sugar transporter subunit IIA [Verrucomicrobiae bacterium]
MYLNLIEVAESFGVSEKVVEGWIQHNSLPCVSDRGRLLFDRARVADWAGSHGLTARTGFLAPEGGVLTDELALAPLLMRGGVWRDVSSADILPVVEKIILSLPMLSPNEQKLLSQRIHSKGGIVWAPIGNGYALPHFSTRISLGNNKGFLALIFLKDSSAFQEVSPDGKPLERLVFFVPPSPRSHFGILARLSRLISQGHLCRLNEKETSDEDWMDVISRFDANRLQEENKSPKTRGTES